MKMAESDLKLLDPYARGNSEEAFARLVSRRLDLVYSAALRQVNSPQLAEEVAQSVFADLARNALKLRDRGSPGNRSAPAGRVPRGPKFSS
jgi:DNA-directed RNA polymerase specialized sigma24 family protein